MALPRDAAGRQITENGVAFRFDENEVHLRPSDPGPMIGVEGNRLTCVDIRGYVLVPKERVRRIEGRRVIVDAEPIQLTATGSYDGPDAPDVSIADVKVGARWTVDRDPEGRGVRVRVTPAPDAGEAWPTITVPVERLLEWADRFGDGT